MVKKIDIAMTAVLRPVILEKTLSSFFENLFYKNPERFRLIINIDRIGENIKPKEVIRVCRKFFGKEQLVLIVPKYPSFPNAVINVWSKCTSEYVFHLEDDWALIKKLDIDNMIDILENNKKLACLRLYKKTTPKSHNPIFFKSRYQYSRKGFYVTKDSYTQFGLNPVLVKKEFIDMVLPLLSSGHNPEKQIRGRKLGSKMREVLSNWELGIYATPGEKAWVTDIGRRWLRKSRFRKPRGKFLTWESQ